MKRHRYIFTGCGLLVFAITVLFIWQGGPGGPLQTNVDDLANASQSETSFDMISQYDHLESAGLLSRMRVDPDEPAATAETEINLISTATPSVTVVPSPAETTSPTATPSPAVTVTPTTAPAPSSKQTTATSSAPTPAPTTKKPAATAVPTSTPTPSPSPTPTPQTEATSESDVDGQTQSHAQWLSEIFRLTNEARIDNGVAALSKPDAALVEAAAVRAKECSILFSHTRPDEDGSSCFTVLDEFSITRSFAGENLLTGTSGYLTPESAIAAWMASEGHKKNILQSNFTTVGIGFYSSGGKDYLVQLFIG